MPAPRGGHRAYCFAGFTLDVDRAVLCQGEREIELRPKSLAVLTYLVERHGRLVTKDELLTAIWGNTVVTEGTLVQCLIDIRRTLGDTSQQMIRTVRRRGYRFDLPVTMPDSGPSLSVERPPESATLPVPGSTAPHAWRRIAALIVLTALLGTGIAWWAGAGRTTDGTVPPRGTSIAVLPFVNLTPEPDSGYLADGLAEEILNALVRVDGLQVVGRSSSFMFRDRNEDLRDIGRRLSADYLLEGSVRRDGERIRVSAQLIRADTGYHVWSERFERQPEGLFELQDEVARGVADTLRLQLAGSRGEPLVRPLTASTEAYQALLRGRYHQARRTPYDFALARKHFAQAVALDPALAEGWLGLAQLTLSSFTLGSQPDGLALLEKARGNLARAIELKPDLGEAYAARSFYHQLTMRWAESMADYARAQELAPKNATVFLWSAAGHLTVGHFREASQFVRRALELDPLSRPGHGTYGSCLSFLERTKEAVAQHAHAVTLAPDYPTGWANLLIAHLEAGQFDAARTAAASLETAGGAAEGESLAWIELIERRAAGEVPVVPQHLYAASGFSEPELIILLLLAGDLDRTLWLFEAAAERGVFSMTTIWLGSNPTLRAHFGHPRMAAVLEQMGFTEFWRTTRPPDGCRFTAGRTLSCGPLSGHRAPDHQPPGLPDY